MDEQQRQSKRPTRRKLWGLGMIFVSVVVLIVFLFIPHRLSPENMLMPAVLSRLEIPVTIETFLPETQYTITGDEESREAAWAAMYPPGGGFVTGFDPPQSQLEELNDLATIPDQWCLSMYHQLHCLESLSKAALTKHDGNNSTTNAHNHPEHISHCVSYLMQAIICAGDTSLEKATPQPGPDGEVAASVTGWDTKHTCRSRKTLFNFASRYSVALTERLNGSNT